MSINLRDPEWQEFGASLRASKRNAPPDLLYVKASLTRIQALIISMDTASFMTGDIDDPSPAVELLTFLRGELRRATNQSLFYVITVKKARKDIESLTLIEPGDRVGFIKQFRETLEAGLRNDPQVDWIARVGGPKPDPSPDDPKPAKPRPRVLFSF